MQTQRAYARTDFTDDEQFYVVSKFIEGETLRSTLTQRRWSVIESVRFVQAIAEALAHAHERGLVHRDIKPANILIDSQNGRAHVTDFGLAFRRLNAPAAEGLVGTPNYMSPEQVRFCTEAVDARALAKSPSHRFATAAEFAQALARYLSRVELRTAVSMAYRPRSHRVCSANTA